MLQWLKYAILFSEITQYATGQRNSKPFIPYVPSMLVVSLYKPYWFFAID